MDPQAILRGNMKRIILRWTQWPKCETHGLPLTAVDCVFPCDCAAVIPLKMQNCSQGCKKNKNRAIIKCSFVIELCWWSSFPLKRRAANEYLWIVGFFFLSSRTLVLSQSCTAASRRKHFSAPNGFNWQRSSRTLWEAGRRRRGLDKVDTEQGDGS